MELIRIRHFYTMIVISQSEQSQTMTSKEIAELTNKNHADVMRDIRNLIQQLYNEQESSFALVDYKDKKGENRPMYLLNEELYTIILEKYKGLNRVPNRLQEEASLKTIEQLLKITLIRQFKVLSYRIDGYDPINNVAYEIDEPAHLHKIEKDAKREEEIKNILNCTFVRINL